MAQRRIFEPFYSNETFYSLQDILRQTELKTIFELFIVDVLREIFKQSRSNENFQNLLLKRNIKKRDNRKKVSCQNPIAEEKVNHTQIG